MFPSRGQQKFFNDGGRFFGKPMRACDAELVAFEFFRLDKKVCRTILIHLVKFIPEFEIFSIFCKGSEHFPEGTKDLCNWGHVIYG